LAVPQKRLTVRKWKNMVLIDIREFWKSKGEEDDQWRPSKKGISLTLPQWKALRDSFEDIQLAIKDLN
jgi:hypothetical protein